MWFLDPEYPVWVAKTQMIRSCAHGETTILGDSRPLSGLIPDRMGDGVMNLALGGGSPIETAYLVKHLLKCPRARSASHFVSSTVFMGEVDWTRSALCDFLLPTMEDVRLTSQLGDTSVLQCKGTPTDGHFEITITLNCRLYFPAM